MATTIVAPPAVVATARKLVAAGERVALAVELAWVVEAPGTTPFAMRYDVAKGSSCTATFSYRLDDGMVITAAPVSFKR